MTATATDKAGQQKQITVAAQEYPTELFLYKFKTANALLGMPVTVNTLEWEPVALTNRSEMLEFEQKHGGQFTTRVRFQPIAFGRMLAKIAHSFAVAHIGLNSFKPMTLDVILGRTDNISHVVGGSYEIEPPIPDAGHLVSLEYRVEPLMRRSLIVVHIRLFASTFTPSYHVVTGSIQNAEHVNTLFEQMQNAETVQFVLPAGKFPTK